MLWYSLTLNLWNLNSLSCVLTYKGLKPLSRWKLDFPDQMKKSARNKILNQTRKVLQLWQSETFVWTCNSSLSENAAERMTAADWKKMSSSPRSMWIGSQLFECPRVVLETLSNMDTGKKLRRWISSADFVSLGLSNCRDAWLFVPQYRKVLWRITKEFSNEQPINTSKAH